MNPSQQTAHGGENQKLNKAGFKRDGSDSKGPNAKLAKSFDNKFDNGPNQKFNNYKRQSGPNRPDMFQLFNGHSWESISEESNPVVPYSRRCRLFIGGLPTNITEEEIKKLFAKYGEPREIYLSGKSYAFVRLDSYGTACVAKEGINGSSFKNHTLRVSFATHGAAIKLKELGSEVSDQMLYRLFSYFGEVQRAEHYCNEKSEPTGNGIIEFEKKNNALEALHAIESHVITFSNRFKPIVAELLVEPDDGGWPERMASKYRKSQQIRPMFPLVASPASFEEHIGQKWKSIYKKEKERRDALEEEFKADRDKLLCEVDMEYHTFETNQLRQREEQFERFGAQKFERIEAQKNDRFQMNENNFGNVHDNNQNQKSFDHSEPFRGPPQPFVGNASNNFVMANNNPYGSNFEVPQNVPFTQQGPQNSHIILGPGGNNGPPFLNQQNSYRDPNQFMDDHQQLPFMNFNQGPHMNQGMNHHGPPHHQNDFRGGPVMLAPPNQQPNPGMNRPNFQNQQRPNHLKRPFQKNAPLRNGGGIVKTHNTMNNFRQGSKLPRKRNNTNKPKAEVAQ
uniref:RRM domain-containing protein n=1 Tax=Rhabditophanes sp. KR3021 TaxID=114890 RepID=A0AC35TN31_9BILA